jgi:hypothetical protein
LASNGTFAVAAATEKGGRRNQQQQVWRSSATDCPLQVLKSGRVTF